MKLTIITGPQSNGKTTYLRSLYNNINTVQYSADRLKSWPIYAPALTDNINRIVFDIEDTQEKEPYYLLALIAAANELRFKRHVPGIRESRANIEIVVAIQIPKKDIKHIFKGLTNVSFIELKPKYD